MMLPGIQFCYHKLGRPGIYILQGKISVCVALNQQIIFFFQKKPESAGVKWVGWGKMGSVDY